MYTSGFPDTCMYVYIYITIHYLMLNYSILYIMLFQHECILNIHTALKYNIVV